MGKGMKNRKTYKREYYYKNKENITKYRLKNKEKLRDYDKKYSLENKEKKKAYRLKNREQFRQWNKEYYQRNKQWIKEKRIQSWGRSILCVGEKSLLLRRLPSPLCSVTPQRRNEMEKCHQL